MKVIVAKTAGFCYGVSRALEIAEKAAVQSERCYTLGSLVHNRYAVSSLLNKGVREVSDIRELPPGSTVIIRSHGISRNVYNDLKEKGHTIIDATCPNVSRIHRIVEKASEQGRVTVIIGSREHPEVQAICGWADTAVVFKDISDIKERIQTELPDKNTPISVVHQTTEALDTVKKCDDFLKKEYTNIEMFDTICDATSRRQKEAEDIASGCDAVIVLGDKRSANALRLAEICKKKCPRVLYAESAIELDLSELDGADIIGVTAGASTPAWIIKEVHKKMTDEFKEMEFNEKANTVSEENISESFDEMLERNFKTLSTGEKVTGTVQSISPTEVSVDLGTKYSGYIPLSELTDDPDLKPEDIVSVGGEIETFVMRVNDIEGTIMLSKKRLDTVKNWETIEQARQERTIVEGTVIEENKGGIIVLVRGIRVFVPASQSGLPKGSELSALLKTKQKLRVTEVNHSRRRVVGSIREAANEVRRALAEQTWNEIEVGKTYTGTVKSLTSYGAFIDIGGVDGMVHVSELSWKRIKHPSEVLNVGDKADVYVLSFDKENRKISLGYRTMADNPWTKFTEDYQIGSIVTVKVVKLMQFGAFAEILPGVDGLIHVSQITNERRIGKPSEILSEDQEVQVKITNIDYEKQKVSLSIKALMEEPEIEVQAESTGEPEVVYDTDAASEYKEAAADSYTQE
ncbi:MAG: bifunctional 4-hydroxy-3-methylbut-2-enyl diphosphate reductase/30S ribosomal protein S1 [Clostridiales bacterium]|nr:bifunctional 4-hydroxy-3-methylbut-2-enyl diphosphate reductase/30S ribosomal protein S1 [Clostridiales bacterium]